MSIRNTIFAFAFLLASSLAWSTVFIRWTSSSLPPTAAELGVTDLVIPWNNSFQAQVRAARTRGYRVYVEVPLDKAAAAATSASELAGIILTAQASENEEVKKALPKLREAHPRLKFLVLDPEGKQPEMRGSLVIKKGSVLEVSSPTAQPWIDTNLALVKVDQRARPEQSPLYKFSWGAPSDSDSQRPTLTADDYSLAVAEAGAFHADLILDVDNRLQQAIGNRDPQALTLWNQVRLYANFYSHSAEAGLKAAANVALVVDDLDPSDEAMNLLARHNIPFKVFVAGDVRSESLEAFNVVVVFAKPDRSTSERMGDLATRGKTVVLVDAHGSYPWQKGSPERLNEHVLSYVVGNGKVLELSEPVSDPEVFAQDIRRLIGTQNVLLNLWNGLTTIAVPYAQAGENVKSLELINYSGDPLRLQVQVKGSYSSIRYESPELKCCESLVPAEHNGFTEFVIPDLRIAGRVHLDGNHTSNSLSNKK
jgi:hypothetical protein